MIYKFFKYNLLNIFWYYKVRDAKVPDFSIVSTSNCSDILTEFMLNCVGLTISDEEIPKYIYLSEVQRKSKDNAMHFGYKVGLK